MSKILNFLVNTWVFKAQNAPKPVFGRGSAPDPAREAYDAGRETPHPHFPSPRRLRRLASDSRSSLRLIPTLVTWIHVYVPSRASMRLISQQRSRPISVSLDVDVFI